jgi:hypothetical protein
MQRRILRCDRLDDGVCCEGRIAGLVPVALGCCGADASRCLIIVGQLLCSGGKRSAEKISPEWARLDCRDPDPARSGSERVGASESPSTANFVEL